MPNVSQARYQNVFRLPKPEATGPLGEHNSRVTKRNRQIISCSACRRRKLKCDRQSPCSSCTLNANAGSCSFLQSDQEQQHVKRPKPSEAQARLQKLEEMVRSLMQAARNSSDNVIGTTPTRSDNTDIGLFVRGSPVLPSAFPSAAEGVLDFNGSETSYRGATHWATILGNIHDIQDCFESGADKPEDASLFPFSDQPELTIVEGQFMTMSDFIDHLPTRAVADKLLSIYFNAEYFRVPTIHTGKFMREYDSFWANASSVSILWISMLYSMFWISSQINRKSGAPSLISTTSKPDFDVLAGNALVSGKYHKARPYSVEAVLLYGLCKIWKGEDSDADAWMVMGIGARLALRMGYHRDPSHLSNISPFEGEMRRRNFCLIETFDLLLSFQAGLPAIINADDCDTEPARNLFDEDFDENCTTLPPSRPCSDHTPMTYYYYKNRITRSFHRIVRHTLYDNPPSREKTWLLDSEIQKVHDEMPPSLRIKPLRFCLADKIHNILHRLIIELVYLKGLCVLHRRYLTQETLNRDYDNHRKRCGEASLRMLSLQVELHSTSGPDGIFYNDRWMLSTIAQHDFLIAATITCLGLYESRQFSILPRDCIGFQESSYVALKQSHQIWMALRESSREARRVSNILAVMLAKISAMAPSSVELPQNIPDIPQTSIEVDNSAIADSEMESFSQNTVRTDAQRQELSINWTNLTHMDPLNDFLTDPHNVDWGQLDQFLVGYDHEYSEMI